MVKHTQTIRQQQPTNCLSVFGHFMGSPLKGLKLFQIIIQQQQRLTGIFSWRKTSKLQKVILMISKEQTSNWERRTKF